MDSDSVGWINAAIRAEIAMALITTVIIIGAF